MRISDQYLHEEIPVEVVRFLGLDSILGQMEIGILEPDGDGVQFKTTDQILVPAVLFVNNVISLSTSRPVGGFDVDSLQMVTRN